MILKNLDLVVVQERFEARELWEAPLEQTKRYSIGLEPGNRFIALRNLVNNEVIPHFPSTLADLNLWTEVHKSHVAPELNDLLVALGYEAPPADVDVNIRRRVGRYAIGRRDYNIPR